MMLFSLNENEQIILSISVAFLITLFLIPIIVRVARTRGIVAHENGRTSHTGTIPTMGGLAIITGFYISVLLFVNDINFRELNPLLAGSLLILLSGMKDDMVGISARKKVIVQIISACIIIFWANVRFTSLQGFLGIHEINYFWSVMITLITIVGLTNCFNLIDGIDGLAPGLSIVSLLTLGIWFRIIDQSELMMISFILAGALIAFIPHNVFGRKNKIFQGDTGSLTTGFIIAFLIIKFNQLNLSISPEYFLQSAPAISVAIVFVPLFDTLRVFILRLSKNRSPFMPDKLHAHHALISLCLTHTQTSFILVCLNAMFILLAFMTSPLGTTADVFILLITGIVLFYIPAAIKRKKQHKPMFSVNP